MYKHKYGEQDRRGDGDKKITMSCQFKKLNTQVTYSCINQNIDVLINAWIDEDKKNINDFVNKEPS